MKPVAFDFLPYEASREQSHGSAFRIPQRRRQHESQTLFMKLFFLLLLSPLLLPGVTVSNIQFDGASHSALRVSFNVSGTYNEIRLRYGPSDCAGGTGGTVQTSGTGSFPLFGGTVNIAGLAPSTLYYFCPEASTDSGATWTSGISASHSMAALPSPHPALPIAPTTFDTSYPATGGYSTVNVASDCSDLQSKINTAGGSLGSGGTIVQIPAGTLCTGNYTTPTAADAQTWSPSAVTTSTCTIHLPSHGFAANQGIRMSMASIADDSLALPGASLYPSGLNTSKTGGFVPGYVYYVIRTDADNFQLSATAGGSALPCGYVVVSSVSTGASTITINPTLADPSGYVWTTSTAIQFASSGSLPTGISADTTYYPLTACPSGGVCTTQLATTISGSPISISSTGSGVMTVVDQGDGTNYIAPWPPAVNNWVIVRTATADSAFAPAGVRADGPTWQPKMATFQQTVWDTGSSFLIYTGTLSHNFRFVGLEFLPTVSTENTTTTDPRPMSNFLRINQDSGNIVFDRTYVHGLGYPNRLYIFSYFDGANVAIVNSDLEHMDFWHPWYSGFTPAVSSGTVATLAAGTAHMGIITPATSTSTTITMTGGTATGTGYIYFDMAGVLQVLLPTGMTATCTTTGATCTPSTSGSPTWPLNGNGRVAGEKIATLTLVSGAIAAASAADGFSSASDTEGCQCIIAGNGPGPYVISNNTIMGSGIPVHFDDSGGSHLARGDYSITRNTFRTPLSECVGTLETDGLRYGHRQPLEWKGGRRISVDGNLFDGNCAEINSNSVFIALTPRSKGYVTDYSVTNNTFQNGPGGLEACLPIDSAPPQSPPCLRTRIANNTFAGINGWLYTTPGVAIGQGWSFHAGYGSEDFIVDHNTFYDPRGPNTEFIHQVLTPNEGTSITNNLLWISDGRNGIMGENVANCSGNSKTLADCMWTSGPGVTAYRFAGNVAVPSWLNSAVPSGATDPAGVCTSYGGTWSSSCAGSIWAGISSGVDVPARIASLGFYSAANLRPMPSSPLNSGSALATDGLAVGADQDAIDVARGVVRLPGFTALSGSGASVQIYAPDAVGCPVDWSTSSSFSSFARIPNGGGARVQPISITGLSGKTTYFYRVLCQVQQPQGSFTTP